MGRLLRIVVGASALCYAVGYASPATRIFTVEDGLARNIIHKIMRDAHGFLWFCTPEGISVFDGVGFTNFTTKEGLPNRGVADITQGRDGAIWIASGVDVVRFHAKALASGGHFEAFHVSAPRVVEAVAVDEAGNVWAGVSGGLYVLKPSNKYRAENVPSSVIPSGDSVQALAVDRKQRLWIGTETGLYVRDTNGAINQVARDRGVKRFHALLVDSSGRIWAGGDTLIEVEEASNSSFSYSPVPFRGVVETLAEDANGQIWFGGFGIYRFDPATREITDVGASIRSEGTAVGSIAADTRGNIWAALSNFGALRISREPVEQFNAESGLEPSFVAGIFQSRDKQTMVVVDSPRRLYAMTNSGLKRYEISTGSRTRFDWGWGSGSIALQDRQNEWWMASGKGVLRFAPAADPGQLAKTTPRVYTTSDGLPHNTVLRIFEDSRGQIWAGTLHGLARFDRRNGRWKAFHVQVPPGVYVALEAVHSIAEDRAGAVWAGFTGPLVLRVRGDDSETIPLPLDRGYINALLCDHSGRLWFGTSTRGVAVINDPVALHPEFTFRTRNDGLSSDQVYSLSEDRTGRVYVVGGLGIDRIDPVTGKIRHFAVSGFMARGEITMSAVDHMGALWFGSAAGVTRYIPEPDRTEAPPAPLLRAVTIAGAPLNIPALGETNVSRIELQPAQHSIAVHFRALRFMQDRPFQYQYRLIGAGNRWSAPSELESVQFANLRPGSYLFEVRTVGETGLMSGPATLAFTLPPPVWQRWWFLMLCALALASALYALHRYRVNHLLMVERVRARLATDLHDDLGAGLAEISILSEVAKRRPQDATVMDLVGQRARSLRVSLSDIVWSVDPKRDRLSDLVDRMRDTAFRLLETQDCRVDFAVPSHAVLHDIQLGPDQRRNLFLFFKEAMTNVARHADATQVQVAIEIRGPGLTLRITDNGKGFDPAARYTGCGLANMRERAARMGGSVQITSTEGAGVAIELHGTT